MWFWVDILMIETQTSKVVDNYIDAYLKLYQRETRAVEILDADWIVVNGAKMRVTDLAYLTTRLQQEYHQSTAGRRSVVQRLISWFKN